jgi:hypothetical protein
MDDGLGPAAACNIPEVCRALSTWALDWRFIPNTTEARGRFPHRLIAASPHGRTSRSIDEELRLGSRDACGKKPSQRLSHCGNFHVQVAWTMWGNRRPRCSSMPPSGLSQWKYNRIRCTDGLTRRNITGSGILREATGGCEG